MNQNKIKDIHSDFKKALQRLEESLSEDISKSTTIIDGTIQRFEFIFELSWKLLKAILYFQGIEANSPRMVVKEAYKAKLIKEGDLWIDMLEDRNKTSHIYDEKQSLKIYKKIKKTHIKLLNELNKIVSEAILKKFNK
ncbi:MAG: nucleotidyltransferase substrate binding protein [Elusimicrobiales bacterium]|nr:nucleotidyltransferase substrate binding protein [Elusimicrobiales bacterium]MCK5106257.1 nucleotidyltransferase substrate binding protein [Elusimicrobiales bacterium]MCK5584003.1 nucleotidyltransferase substrate binding protein [Elusimicrobiales bacterium]